MPERRIINGYIVERQDDGTIVTIGPAPQAPMTIGTPNPVSQFDVPKAEADLARTNAEIAKARIDASVASQTAQAEIAKANAEAAKVQADLERMSRGGTSSETERANALTGYQSALALEKIIADLEQKYAAGPGSTKGVAGVLDYLPTAKNEQFDRAANAARGIVGQALGFTGGQLNSAEEAKLNIGPYIPSASDKDATILDSIQRLKDLRQQAIDRSVSILGGVPDAAGNIRPINTPKYDLSRDRQNPGGNNPRMTAGKEGERYLTEDDLRIQAGANALIQRGASLAEVNAFLRQNGKPDLNVASEAEYNKRRQQGSQLSIPPTGVRTRSQEVLGGIATNPVFAAGANALDAVGMGTLSAIAGDQLDAVSAQNPLPALGGQVAGSIGGTAVIGALGRNTLGRAIPRLMADSGKARFGRNLAADVAYGATYGGVADQDPLSGALAGAIGSAGGQAVGKAAGAAATGITLDPAVQALRNAGVRTTAGRMLGPMARKIEDRAASIPIVGDMIQARQMDSFGDFNLAEAQIGGRPIGFTPTRVAEDGIEDFQAAKSDAYTNALSGRSLPVEQSFMDDLTNMQASKSALPASLQNDLDTLMNTHTAGLGVGSQISGEEYQRAMMALKAARGGAQQANPVFAQPYRDSITQGMDAFRGLADRSDPELSALLGKADASNRAFKILEEAALDRAAVGTKAGTPEVFAPSDILRSIRKSEKKYGKSPLTDEMKALARSGQEVLPATVPESGTSGRLAQMAMAGGGAAAIGGGGAGLGYLAGGSEGAQSGAQISTALAILAALGGTKGGQKVLTGILDPSNRPASAIAARNALRQRLRKGGSGIFGSAGAGLALASGG